MDIIQKRAQHFGEGARAGQWLFAADVACCVFRGKETDKINITAVTMGKVSTYEFAEKSSTSVPRVLRYLGAWEAAAAKRLCTPTSKLRPEDNPPLPSADRWEEFYPPVDPSKLSEERLAIIEEVSQRTGLAQATVQRVMANPEAITAAIAVDPVIAEAVATDHDAHMAVIRASLAKDPPGRLEPRSIAEPFARMLTLLNMYAITADVDAMYDVVMRDFTGGYAWRPGEQEAVLECLDRAAQRLADARAVLTSEVSDEELARLMEGGV